MLLAAWETIDWQHRYLVWGVAVLAVAMLAGTWVLARRRGKINRGAVICGVVSVLLHALLIALLPYAQRRGGGPPRPGQRPDAGVIADINIGAFSDPEQTEIASGGEDPRRSSATPALPPLPASPERLPAAIAGEAEPEPSVDAAPDEEVGPPESVWETPAELAVDAARKAKEGIDTRLDQWLSDVLAEQPDAGGAKEPADPAIAEPSVSGLSESSAADATAERILADGRSGSPAKAPPGRVFAERLGEFANRAGAAKQQALWANGGDLETEAAVQAAIGWLANYQAADGSWDPRASGGGVERNVLGQSRQGAGTRATTGISGLALLALLGAGHTHQQGEHQQVVRRGLQYLINVQQPNGALSGEATLYARTYCHGMAALAMCEAAAISRDAVAVDSARRAVDFTLRSQHATTGGWRYLPGDPGDTSQLGWQAMVLTSGRAAGVDVPERSLLLTSRFLRSVRGGRHGGLAAYKPGEQVSRTMTAEALAVRLLLGEQVPEAEAREAEAYLLEELPGTAADNFYFWYYASLALHQRQGDAWQQWNARMKRRLLELQQADGSWPASTTWGGYGGRVYTTAMACLCLEVYYRHLTVDERGAAVADVHSELLRRR